MSNKAKVFVGLGVAAAFVVGMGAGAAAGPADDTNTKTLHSPTVTVTPAAQARTPQSCLNALDAAESLMSDASDFSTTSTQWPNLVKRALYAGYNQNIPAIRGITADIQSISSEVVAETASVNTHGATFRSNAAACRADTP